jgi:hypothetical protein
MTFNRHWMRNLKPHHVQIRLADGSVVYSEGVGSVRFNPVISGQKMAPLEFTDVLYVPALCTNIFSVLYLTLHRRFTVSIERDTMHFIRDGKVTCQATTGASNAAYLVGDTIHLRDDLRIMMPVFVDDITLACKDGAKIDSVVQGLSQHFKLRDLGPTTQLLGLEIHRDRPNRRLSISQSQFITNLLQEHSLSDSKPVSTPVDPGLRLSTSMCPQNDAEALEMRQYPYISVVGSLMYLAFTTRPDIAYAAGVLARFNSNPGLAHWQAAKHVLCYLKGTTTHKLIYQPSTSPEPFITYSDADHGGNPDNGKSTGGYVVKIGSGAVSWSSKLQSLVALSTTEAEHISAVEAGKEILWIRSFMGELGYDISGPSLLRMDNQSAIAVSKNPEHHSKMKHSLSSSILASGMLFKMA